MAVPPPVAVAVLLSLPVPPTPANASLPVPVAWAVLLLLLLSAPSSAPAYASVSAPLANALLWLPPAAVAVLLSPRAIATEPVPDAEEVAEPLSTRVAPPADTLKLVAGLVFEAVVVDAVDVESGDDDEPELGGLADATHGVAAIPTPMPRATANAPSRPIYLAYP